MPDEVLIEHAVALLRTDAEALADARDSARMNKSLLGSVMAMTWSKPRQHAEEAVREAIRRLDKECASAQRRERRR